MLDRALTAVRCIGLWTALASCVACSVEPAWSVEMAGSIAAKPSYLDNGTIKIGVDLARGGAIVYLTRVEDRPEKNLVNTYDLGREIQQSYYSGPDNFQPTNTVQHSGWPKWPWNPVQAGDSFHNPSGVLAHHNDGSEIYVKSCPKHWALEDYPADCTMEQWTTLDGNVVVVRNRLTNARSDKTFYPGRHQELPAVYTNTMLTRLVTYHGLRPFSKAATSEIAVVGKTPRGPPWTYWRATENWAAFVDESDRGLGVFLPGCVLFAGGYTGEAGGGSKDASTGYIAPIRTEILDHDLVYEYTYYLILGRLDEIRKYVYAHKAEERPDYQFRGSRQHWTYVNASDSGVSAGRPLHIEWKAKGDPQMISAETAFQAARVKRLYIRAAYHLDGASDTGLLYWEADSGVQPIGEERSQAFSVIGDGKYRTYVVDLAANSQWKGLISRLRFDPATSKAGSMDLLWISFKPVARSKAILPAAEK